MTCNCNPVDDIIPAIGEAMKGDVPPDSLMATSCTRRKALEVLKSNVGNGVYWYRRAEPTGTSAIRLRSLGGSPRYDLVGEISTAQPVVEVTVFTKGEAPLICSRIATAARIALSGYRGALWDYNQTLAYIHGATILREQTDPSQLPVQAGGYWAFAAGFDIQVTYDRTVSREVCDGMYR